MLGDKRKESRFLKETGILNSVRILTETPKFAGEEEILPAQQEQLRAQQEQLRAEKLAQYLRSLGVDPDNLPSEQP